MSGATNDRSRQARMRPPLIRQDATRDLGVDTPKATSDMEHENSSESSSNEKSSNDAKEGKLLTALSNDHMVIEVDHGDRRLEEIRRSRPRSLVVSTSEGSAPRGSGTFTIQYQYLSTMTTQQKASFEYAAQRIGKMITTKHQPINTSGISEKCTAIPNQPLPPVIGDMFIFVSVRPIDGVKNTLGQAGPCMWDNNGFPRVGFVEFDVADVEDMINSETFDAVCVHEIFHIVGIGTLWQYKNLVGGTSSDPRFMGVNGVKALPKINGQFMGTPAIQDTGGEGTAGSHWRETAFGDEMMTAYLSAPYQPVSALTVDSLKDLGYTVDSSTADIFNVSANGYNTPNVPYNENKPTWFDFNSSSGFWTSTTIWIIACAGGLVVVFLVSCMYARMKARRNKSLARPPRPSNPPMPMSSAPRPPVPAPPPYAIPPASQYPTTAIPQAVYVKENTRFPPTQVPAYGDVPVAYPVVDGGSAGVRGTRPVGTAATETQNVSMFMEITRCTDRALATRYMREAQGNVSLAVDRYMQNNDRQMAVV